MKNRYLAGCFCLCLLAACGGQQAGAGDTAPKENLTAQQIAEAAIEKHGGAHLANSRVAFRFRDRAYVAIREGGRFQYERLFTDTAGQSIRDVLTHQGFYREVDGQRVAFPPKDRSAYANSVNSVIYFALLPYFLNDEAVILELLGESTIKGQPYYELKATFRQEGGGKDFEDEYIYWIHRDSSTMDYLAYNYLVDGGGARFREAYNIRTINGVRFADYRNYQPLTDTREVAAFDSLFQSNGLEVLSLIELEEVQVE